MNIPDELLRALKDAEKIAALTGAGISKESGIPTFREAQTGLWAQYDPQELATPGAFARDPKLVWEWYTWRRGLVAGGEPNAGHAALAELESMVPQFTLITQNVDGFHRQAGSRNVLELHGDITRTICSRERTPVEAWEDEEEIPPRCPDCGSYLRPNVVWFGEGLPQGALEASSRAAREADVFFSIGTSALVYPAAALPMEARRNGALIVEVNPDETPLTHDARFVLRGAAGEVLPELVAKFKEILGDDHAS